MQRRLKKSVVYVLYGLGFVFMLIGLLIISKNKIGYSSDYERRKMISLKGHMIIAIL